MYKYIKYFFWLCFGFPIFIFSKILMKLYGWKAINTISKNVKGVIIAAPHTSNWDAFWGIMWLAAYIWPTRVKLGFKKEASAFPFGYLFKAIGGVPIDRHQSSQINTLKILLNAFKSLPQGFVILTPEGTRKLTTNWSKGFYYIARKTKVPVICWKIDYKNREFICAPPLELTGNFSEDMKIINEFYRNSNPKHPNNFALHEDSKSKSKN